MKKKTIAFISPLLVIALLFLAQPVAAYTAGPADAAPEYREVAFQWYFLVGTTVGECNANCYGACMPACASAAAGAGIDAGNCGGSCGGQCAAQCPPYFANTVQADDGLPQVPQIAPGTPSLGGIGINVDGETPESNLPEAGVTVGSQECPAFAPDGHPMRWDQILGCYDIFWKNDYCGTATSCNYENPCTAKQGCLWNGAACVPCNAPSCIYSCPDRPRQVAKQADIPAPNAVIVQKPQQAGAGAQPGGAGGAQPSPTGTTVATPVPTPTYATPVPTVAATPLPTPAVQAQCNSYSSCGACAKAPKGGDNECAWSEFLNSCVDATVWDAVNASGLKVGWANEEKYCPKERTTYCFQYKDCFSCAGAEGVKRNCQWSTDANACVPYNPLNEFRTASNPKAANVIVPQLCGEGDCSKYSDCLACERNAACLWTRGEGNCVPFQGDGDTKLYYFYPSSCRVNATPTPTPAPCPAGCNCTANAKIVSCNSKPVNTTRLLLVDRAAANAGAATSMEKVDSIEFNQEGTRSYVVRGHRNANFLFIFPVRLDVTATVNAQTGAVEKVDSPWWGFLAG